jgi:hypothetical protein
MKDKFVVTWPANIFQIVDSISEWENKSGCEGGVHSLQGMRKLYDARFGINECDSIYLNQYAPIRSRTGWGPLDSAFVPAKSVSEALKNAKKVVTTFEFGILKKVYQYFEENVKMMYDDFRPYLTRRGREIKGMHGEFDFDGLFSEIARFYESGGRQDAVNAHLVINTCDGASGGLFCVHPPTDFILEPVQLGKSDDTYTLADLRIYAHEKSHPIENSEKGKWDKFYEIWRDKGLRPFEIDMLRESILGTMVPDGILARKYGLIRRSTVPDDADIDIVSKDQCKTCHYKTFRDKLAAQLYGITTRHLRRGKSVFDGNYMANAADTLIKLRPY